MTALKWPDKDPDEVTDFIVNWSERLRGGDTINTSEWIVPSGITMNSNSISNDATLPDGTEHQNFTTIWLSGGTEGASYSFVNRIHTVGGRVYDQTLKLKVKER